MYYKFLTDFLVKLVTGLVTLGNFSLYQVSHKKEKCRKGSACEEAHGPREKNNLRGENICHKFPLVFTEMIE